MMQMLRDSHVVLRSRHHECNGQVSENGRWGVLKSYRKCGRRVGVLLIDVSRTLSSFEGTWPYTNLQRCCHLSRLLFLRRA